MRLVTLICEISVGRFPTDFLFNKDREPNDDRLFAFYVSIFFNRSFSPFSSIII